MRHRLQPGRLEGTPGCRHSRTPRRDLPCRRPLLSGPPLHRTSREHRALLQTTPHPGVRLRYTAPLLLAPLVIVLSGAVPRSGEDLGVQAAPTTARRSNAADMGAPTTRSRSQLDPRRTKVTLDPRGDQRPHLGSHQRALPLVPRTKAPQPYLNDHADGCLPERLPFDRSWRSGPDAASTMMRRRGDGFSLVGRAGRSERHSGQSARTLDMHHHICGAARPAYNSRSCNRRSGCRCCGPAPASRPTCASSRGASVARA